MGWASEVNPSPQGIARELNAPNVALFLNDALDRRRYYGERDGLADKRVNGRPPACLRYRLIKI
jgi:hypothetical protein